MRSENMSEKKAFTIDDVLRDLEAQIKESGNQRTWAFENDFSPAFVSYVTTRKRLPSERMLSYLGYEKATDIYYKRS